MNPVSFPGHWSTKVKNIFLDLSNHQRLSLLLVVALYIVMIVSGGGKGIFFPVFVSITSLFLLVLNKVSGTPLHAGAYEKILTGSLIFFVGYGGISSALASDVYLSLQGLSVWITSTVLFFVAVSIQQDKKLLSAIGITILPLSVLWCAYDLGYFFLNGHGYSRLSGTFLDPNIYGGFLIFSLSLALAFHTQLKGVARMYTLFSLALFTSAIVMTFSRGTWVSVILGLIVFVLGTKGVGLLIRTKSFWKEVLVFTATVIIITGSISFFVTDSFSLFDKASTVRSYETSSENGFSARIHYIKDALQVYSQEPLFGLGFNNYIFKLRAVNNNPVYFSTNVHNSYLEAFVSTGFGGLFFAFFAGLLFLSVFWSGGKFTRPEGVFMSAGGVVIVAMLAHMFVEADSDYPAMIILFFIVAGLFLGGRLYEVQTPIRTEGFVFGKKVFVTLFTAAALTVIFSALSYFSQNRIVDGNYYMLAGNPSKAIISYDNAMAYIPFDAEGLRNRAAANKERARRETDPVKTRTFLLDALEDSRKAIFFSRSDVNLLNLQAEILMALGDIKAAENILNQAKVQDGRNMRTSIALIKLYLADNRKESALGEVRSFLPHLIEYAQSTAFNQDPNKGSIIQYMNNASALLDSSHSKL